MAFNSYINYIHTERKKVKSLSRIQLFETPWTVTYHAPASTGVGCQFLAIPWTVAPQAPLSMEFFRQVYRHGLPCPSPGDLPDPGIKPRPPALQADFYHLSCFIVK